MKNVIGLLVFTIAITCCTQHAMALPEFKKAFEVKYVKGHKKEADFKAVFKSAGCNVCHIKGGPKDKSIQNEYGTLLNKLIEGNAKKRKTAAKEKGGLEAQKEMKAKIMAELEKAFVKAAETKSEAGKGPTYGELLKAGKIPVAVDKAAAKYKEDLKKAAAKQKDAPVKAADTE